MPQRLQLEGARILSPRELTPIIVTQLIRQGVPLALKRGCDAGTCEHIIDEIVLNEIGAREVVVRAILARNVPPDWFREIPSGPFAA